MTEGQKPRRQINRRDVIGGSLGVLAGMSLAGNRAAAQGSTLRVTHFGGPYGALQDLVGRPFAAAGLGTIAYEVELSTTALAKMQAQLSDPPFDVAMVPRAMALRAGNAQLSQTLAAADLPSLAGTVPDTLAERGVGAAFLLDGVDLMYSARLSGAPIAGWNDLWRTDLRGKIGLPGSTLTTVISLIVATTRSMGGSESDDAAVDATFRRFRELRPHVRAFFNDPIVGMQMMDRGDIAVAPQFSIRIANLMRANPDIRRASPKGFVHALPYDLIVTRNTRNPALARRYIDFALSGPIQQAVATNLLATPVATSARLPEAATPFVLETEALFHADNAFLAAKTAEWLRRWNREVQG